jgi:hypothetical protein
MANMSCNRSDLLEYQPLQQSEKLDFLQGVPLFNFWTGTFGQQRLSNLVQIPVFAPS